MSKKFLAMDIGCIECGEGSEVIGIFDTEELAKRLLKNGLMIQCGVRRADMGNIMKKYLRLNYDNA